MHVRLGIIFEVFKGADKFIFKWKPRKHINFEFGQFLHTLKPPCATPKQETNKKNRNMNLRLGIILEVFKGGRQIYIQMKA